jgi:hypothetical protein
MKKIRLYNQKIGIGMGSSEGRNFANFGDKTSYRSMTKSEIKNLKHKNFMFLRKIYVNT